MTKELNSKALDQAAAELDAATTALRALPVEEGGIPFYHADSPLFPVVQGIDKAQGWIDAVRESLDS